MPVIILIALLSTTLFANTRCPARYDDLGIPHVEVSSDNDFYFCFGFYHGADRAWEMDYFRRAAQGRNAEVLGYSQLKSDLMMRLLDLPSLAQKILAAFPPDKRQLLEWYSQGVNVGFERGKISPEFRDTGIDPEPWLPKHTLEVLLLQAFDQTRKTFWTDYKDELRRRNFGERADEILRTDLVPWFDTILKEGEYKTKSEIPTSGIPSPASKSSFVLKNFPEIFGEESGSNNWAVSSKKSLSGHALFANDPHLDLVTPLFWYWIQLKSPEKNIIGASLPGVPLIVSGTNGHVAWGLTNSYINTADAVFVKDIPKEEIISKRPVVWFKFGFLQIPFFFKSFTSTKSGFPFLPLDIEDQDPLLLRWTGFALEPDDIYSMFEIRDVKSVTEMDNLLKHVGLPSWNFAFADSQGDVGFRLIGKVFKTISPGNIGIQRLSYPEFKSFDFLGAENRPSVLKPKRNYVYSANHQHWPTDSLFEGGRGYSSSFRGFRINELLTEKAKLSFDDLKSIQCDEQAVDARFFVPVLLKRFDVPEFENWDFTVSRDSSALPLYRRWMDLMLEEWDLTEEGFWNFLKIANEKEFNIMKKLLTEARTQVKNLKWEKLHRLSFPHLSKNESWIYSPEIAGVGDKQTVNPGTARWNAEKKRYEQFSGASMRMLIEMNDKPRILLSLPGRNRDYSVKSRTSPWEDWRNCRYKEIEF
jgi:penicillin G amidase